MAEMVARPRLGHRWWKWMAMIGAGVVLVAAVGWPVWSTVQSVPKLFRRNAALKAQGYYMGEFEFKMLAAQWSLNEGRYAESWRTLRRIQHEMETTEGLVRMPAGATAEQRMAFLLDRQDAKTGAFMDASYPYFTYYAPTENVIEALDQLARQTGRPLRLQYPLRFLDEIREPARLRAYLDSLLYLREPWDRMPGPGPYGPGVSELASYERLEKLGLYRFSPEWKETLRQWFLETQDPETGFWGHRIGTAERWKQKRDVNSTFHVLKLFQEEGGSGRAVRIAHAVRLARNLLPYLSEAVPERAAAQHEWGLVQAQGTRMVNWLWDQLTPREQEEAQAAMARALELRYRRFFRPADGGFSLYAGDEESDLDGTANALGLLKATGSLAGTRERERLWGKKIAVGAAVARREVKSWGEAALAADGRVNSWRVYAGAAPVGDGYEDGNLVAIVVAGDSAVRDVMELRKHIARLAAGSGQAFGNWSSIESLREQPLGLRGEVRTVAVTRGGVDLARIGREQPGVRVFSVVGCDVFQVPVVRAEFRLQ